jgi:hypothetical protein
VFRQRSEPVNSQIRVQLAASATSVPLVHTFAGTIAVFLYKALILIPAIVPLAFALHPRIKYLHSDYREWKHNSMNQKV